MNAPYPLAPREAIEAIAYAASACQPSSNPIGIALTNLANWLECRDDATALWTATALLDELAISGKVGSTWQ